jgi:hypothetical protein
MPWLVPATLGMATPDTEALVMVIPVTAIPDMVIPVTAIPDMVIPVTAIPDMVIPVTVILVMDTPAMGTILPVATLSDALPKTTMATGILLSEIAIIRATFNDKPFIPAGNPEIPAGPVVAELTNLERNFRS